MTSDKRQISIDFGTGAGIEEMRLRVAGVETFVRYSPGTGPTLVLLPGGMLDSSLLTWKKALEALPAPFRVFVPDPPGYGQSPLPDGAPCTTEWYADWLAALVSALDLGPFALGGSSMSGAVALVYALRHPEKIKKLLLSGAFGVQPRVPLHPAACLAARVPGLPAFFRHALDTPATMRLALLAALGHRHALTDELVADARAGLERPDALDAFAVWLRTELLPDRVRTHVTPSLDRLTMPVLWLHGGRDWMLPVRHTRRAAARCPKGQLHVFSNAGHLVPREFPAAVNARIVAFLLR